MNKIDNKNLCFIIPTYNPSKNFHDVIKKILKFKAKIFIFDNHSENKTYLNKLEGIEIEYSNANYGYGHGINFFLKKYINRFQWFCMLDQDSILDINFFEYVNQYIDIKNKFIGLIGTNVCYKGTNKNLLNLDIAKSFYYQKTLICSGSIISKEHIKKVGFLKSDFFMEYIDVEYCLRLESNGFKNVISSKVFLIQEFGKNEIINFFGRVISIDNHNPMRYFYRARNLKYCMIKYFKTQKKVILIHIYNFIKMLIKILIFERQKFPKIFQILRGFFKNL